MEKHIFIVPGHGPEISLQMGMESMQVTFLCDICCVIHFGAYTILFFREAGVEVV